VIFPHSVGPGDPIPTDAATWNALLGAAHAHRRGDRPQPGGGGLSFGGVVEAYALNSTGAALAPNRPAAVTAAGGIDVTGDGGPPWQRTPVVTLGVPGASTDFVVVTLEAIPAGQIGRVAVAGAVLCNLKVNGSGDGYAAPTTNTTALESAASGPIRVLHKGTGSSTRRCLVYLGDQVAAAGATITAQDAAIGSNPTGAINLTGSWTNLATLAISATGTYLVGHHMSGLCQTIGAPSGAAANIGTRIATDAALDEFATLSPTLPWAPVYWCQAEGATVTRYETMAVTFPVPLTAGDTLYSQGKFYVGGGAVIGTTALASIRGRNTDTTPPIGGPQNEARLWAVRLT
jgi:hypothetical protein